MASTRLPSLSTSDILVWTILELRTDDEPESGELRTLERASRRAADEAVQDSRPFQDFVLDLAIGAGEQVADGDPVNGLVGEGGLELRLPNALLVTARDGPCATAEQERDFGLRETGAAPMSAQMIVEYV